MTAYPATALPENTGGTAAGIVRRTRNAAISIAFATFALSGIAVFFPLLASFMADASDLQAIINGFKIIDFEVPAAFNLAPILILVLAMVALALKIAKDMVAIIGEMGEGECHNETAETSRALPILAAIALHLAIMLASLHLIAAVSTAAAAFPVGPETEAGVSYLAAFCNITFVVCLCTQPVGLIISIVRCAKRRSLSNALLPALWLGVASPAACVAVAASFPAIAMLFIMLAKLLTFVFSAIAFVILLPVIIPIVIGAVFLFLRMMIRFA